MDADTLATLAFGPQAEACGAARCAHVFGTGVDVGAMLALVSRDGAGCVDSSLRAEEGDRMPAGPGFGGGPAAAPGTTAAVTGRTPAGGTAFGGGPVADAVAGSWTPAGGAAFGGGPATALLLDFPTGGRTPTGAAFGGGDPAETAVRPAASGEPAGVRAAPLNAST